MRKRSKVSVEVNADVDIVRILVPLRYAPIPDIATTPEPNGVMPVSV